jgi:hypothetical protein
MFHPSKVSKIQEKWNLLFRSTIQEDKEYKRMKVARTRSREDTKHTQHYQLGHCSWKKILQTKITKRTYITKNLESHQQSKVNTVPFQAEESASR